MAIAFDAASASSNSGTNQSSFSWSHTTGSSLVDSLLLICVTWRNGGASTWGVSTITYGGSAAGISLVKKTGQDGGSGSRNTAIYALKNPGAGGNTIVVTLTGSAYVLQGGAITLQGVDQTTPTGAVTGQVDDNEDPVIVTLNTTTANNWVIDCITGRKDNSNESIIGEETEFWNRSHPDNYGIVSGGQYVGPNPSGNVVMGWDLISFNDKETAISAIEVIEAAAAGPANVGKVDGIEAADIGAINGVSYADILEINGVD